MAADGLIPIFRKTLTKSDVDYEQLYLPVDAFGSLPPFEPGSNTMTLPVEDVEFRRHYNFQCRLRNTGHPRPVFSGGWREYVREKVPIVGDDLILYMAPAGGGGGGGGRGRRYYVTLDRTGLKLFGVVMRPLVV